MIGQTFLYKARTLLRKLVISHELGEEDDGDDNLSESEGWDQAELQFGGGGGTRDHNLFHTWIVELDVLV